MVKTVLKVVLPLLVLAGAAAGGREIVRNAKQPEPRPKEDLVPVVRVVAPVQRSVRLDVVTYGTVRPRSEVSVVPQISGRVVHVSPSFREGGFFAAEEVLVRIDRRDYVLARTQAEAGVAQAQARLDREEAEAEMARKEWSKYGQGEPSALVVREPQLMEARAVLASAQARLDTAKLNLERADIKAPYAGRVRTENVDKGQFLAVGVPIASIYATDFAEVRLAIPDDQLAFLRLPLDYSAESERAADGGAEVKAVPVTLSTTYGGRECRWEATIVRTEAEVDPRTRVVHVLARVPDPYRQRSPGQPPLMVGMYLKASIPGKEMPGVMTLPRSALVGRSEIIVVDGDSRLRRRAVVILRREKERIIVTDGIGPGERVCLTKVEPLVEGMRVRVEESR